MEILRPHSGVRRGVSSLRGFFHFVTMLLMYDLKSLQIQLVVVLYADGTLFYIPRRRQKQAGDI